MNAELIDLDPDFLRDADSTAEIPIAAPQGQVRTARLASLVGSSSPPPLRTAPMPALPPPFTSQTVGPSLPSGLRARRPSWIRDLISTALAPSNEAGTSIDDRLTRRTAGAACVGVAMAFALAALVTGLRGAPDPSLPAAVGAALVVARSLVALGAGAFSFGLLRMAERLLAPRDGA